MTTYLGNRRHLCKKKTKKKNTRGFMHTKSAGVDATLLLWNVYIGSTMAGMCVSMYARVHVCVRAWASSVVYKRKKSVQP